MREDENENDLEMPKCENKKAMEIFDKINNFIATLESEGDEEIDLNCTITPVLVNLKDDPIQIVFSGVNNVEISMTFEVNENAK